MSTDAAAVPEPDPVLVPVTPATRQAFIDVDALAFFFEESEPPDAVFSMLDLDRSFGLTRTGEPPFEGIYSTFDLRVGIPLPGGPIGPVPVDGLTWVGIDPDHRRRGHLTRMIRHQFDRARDAGVALAGLHASEPAIYGRFGYAVASTDVVLSPSRGASVTAPPEVEASAETVRTSSVGQGDEGVGDRWHALHEDIASRTLGGVVRPLRLTRSLTRDFPTARRGSERERLVFAQRDGVDVGYAVFQRTHKWDDGNPSGSVHCWELEAADAGARLALLRRLVDMDLTSEVTLANRSMDDPILWWLGGPRAVRTVVNDALWLRLVDVGSALAQRGWAAPVDLVIDVADEFCPWNAGRWRLTCADPAGAATCTRTDDPADVRMPVQALASAYLGLRPPAAQAAAGTVVELTPGAVAALSLTMATPHLPSAGVGF